MDESTEGNTIRLCAVGAFDLAGRIFDPGDEFLVSEDDAISLVFDAVADVAEKQNNPPLTILDELTSRLGDLDRIGKVSLSEAVLGSFEDKAISFGARRAIVENRALDWKRGRAEAKEQFQELLSGIAAYEFSRLKAQLHACMKTKQEGSEEIDLSENISDQSALEQGLLRLSKLRGRRRLSDIIGGRRKSGTTYVRVGPGWAEFGLKLASFEEQLEAEFVECLESGRILTIEQSSTGATLFAPTNWWGKPPSRKVQNDLYFLMSSDLPQAWYRKSKILKGKERARFVSWLVCVLEANYLAEQPDGKKLKRDTFVKLVVAEAGCADSVARSAWQAARIPKWKKHGNVPDGNILHEIDFKPGQTKR